MDFMLISLFLVFNNERLSFSSLLSYKKINAEETRKIEHKDSSGGKIKFEISFLSNKYINFFFFKLLNSFEEMFLTLFEELN